MPASGRRPPWFLLVAASIGAIGVLLPLAYLVLRAFEADLQAVQALVFRQRNLRLLFNTLTLSFTVLVGTTLLAVPLAFITVRTDIRHKRLLTILATLPLAVPGYVMAYALISLGGNYGILARLTGLALPRMSGLSGAAAALTLYTYPYLFLNLRAALAGVDPSYEETARSLGYGRTEIFFKVTLPHLRPALLAGWLVIGLYVLGDFGAVALMRYEVFSYAIFTQYHGAFDRVYAAWLSLMLLAMTVGVVGLEWRLLGRTKLWRSGSGVGRKPAEVPLGRTRPFAKLFVWLVILAAVGLPVLILSYWLLLSPPDLRPPQVAASFAASAGASVPAAALAALLALPVAYTAARYPSVISRTLERAAYIGYAIPPLALALAMVFFALRSAPALYQTLPLLILAYALNFQALAIGPIRSAVLQASPRLEEAARSLGRNRVEAFVSTVLPLLRRGIVAGGVLVFVIAMKELPITFLLAPTGYRTLAMNVFSRTSEAMLAQAAPYAAAIVVFSGLFIGFLLKHEGSR